MYLAQNPVIMGLNGYMELDMTKRFTIKTQNTICIISSNTNVCTYFHIFIMLFNYYIL